MITKEQMIPSLLTVCPSFQKEWDAFVTEWADEPETKKKGLPLYLALGDLARHLILLLEAGDEDTLRDVFQIVEAWHIDGDPYVQEAATIGLLENLQNLNLHQTTKPAQFEQYLGPKSLEGWKALYEFWEKVQTWQDSWVRSVTPRSTRPRGTLKSIRDYFRKLP
jgi:hypothetical protein